MKEASVPQYRFLLSRIDQQYFVFSSSEVSKAIDLYSLNCIKQRKVIFSDLLTIRQINSLKFPNSAKINMKY